MGPAGTAGRSPPSELGDLLRHWRGRRRWSQLELSAETGISQRHISFIESGRSVVGRQTLLSLARALDVPLREQNSLLLAAGYAPIHPDADLDAPSMRSISDALQRMLRQQEPFPAIVLDRYWDVLMTNEAAPRFFSHFVDLSRRPRPRNLLQLVFDPAGLRPFIGNWEEVATSLVERLHRESVGRVADERTKRLLATLMAYPGVQPRWEAPSSAPDAPAIPLTFERSGDRLSFFSLVTTVGTPRTVAAQELRLECMFPADEDTERSYPLFLGRSMGHP
jgi:transcriptional regulator with XRE-family HTH domain